MTIGQSIPRLEDRRFLTGQGCFTDDLTFPNALHAYVVRSPHAHARIERIDTAAAHAMPGVMAVLTGGDAVADGLGSLKGIVPLPGAIEPARRPLAIDRARHVGDPVALVVAETFAQARDAAERVMWHGRRSPPSSMRRPRWPRMRPCCGTRCRTIAA